MGASIHVTIFHMPYELLTSLYFGICSFLFLFVPWYLLEKPKMEILQIQFNFWIFFSNALCALALNFSIFLVIGRTGAVTIRVAGVLKDWILIALSTVLFPESTITGLNIIGYAIGKFLFKAWCWFLISLVSPFFSSLNIFPAALCGVVMYNYIKVKDVRASQLPMDSIPDRMSKVSFLYLLNTCICKCLKPLSTLIFE